MSRRWGAAGLAAALIAVGAAAPAAGAAPALCGPLRDARLGIVRAPDATELSGLAVSRVQPGVLFAHNDSGDSPRIFAMRTDGTLLARFRVAGAAAVDWEDMTQGPGAGSRPALYVGDIGDNAKARSTVQVYRVPEPVVRGGAEATAPAERLVLRYPDGARDAEALLVDPRSGDLHLVTKSVTGRSELYRARAPLAFGGETTLERVRVLRLGLTSAVTGGDVSAAGDVIVLRTYGSVFVWGRRPGESIGAALGRRPCVARTHVVDERQGEAIGLLPNGRGLITVSEGSRSPIWRYTARAGPS